MTETKLKCEECEFVAKSPVGLSAHTRVHAKDSAPSEETPAETPQEEPVEAPEVPANPTAKPADGNIAADRTPLGGKALIMKNKLDAQPKVPIMIPLAGGEKFGSTESVILNGYRLNIKKGVFVHVPQQVAQVIMESQQATQEAINNYFLMNEQGVSQAMAAKH